MGIDHSLEDIASLCRTAELCIEDLNIDAVIFQASIILHSYRKPELWKDVKQAAGYGQRLLKLYQECWDFCHSETAAGLPDFVRSQCKDGLEHLRTLLIEDGYVALCLEHGQELNHPELQDLYAARGNEEMGNK